jgi:shikimate kinase
VGKVLSKKLLFPFYDLDVLIEKETGLSISEYFKKFGEEEFRKIEKEMLQSTFKFDNSIIATGGGAPCFFDNIDAINMNGISIYLQANAKLLQSRLKERRETRPLINDLNDDELKKYLEDLLIKREQFYSKAHFTVSAIAPIEKILKIINFKAIQDF